MRHVLLIMFFFACTNLHAEMTIETIELHHRSADEVVNTILPMVAPGGSITSSGYKLFIKSTPDNIEQLRHMVADIDVEARQLLVSVSLDRAVMRENKGASARISVQGKQTLHLGKKSREPTDIDVQHRDSHIKYDVRMFRHEQTQHTPHVQTVRVTEGLWATIKTGQAIPVASRTRNPDGTVTETYTYTAVASGFRVLPRVHGDSVTLSIRPQSQSPSQTYGGAYNTTEMDTTVSGKLGHWIALGSVGESRNETTSGITYRTQQRGDENNQMYVKVELLQQ